MPNPGRIGFQFLLGGVTFALAAWLATSNAVSSKTQALLAVIPLGFLITIVESDCDTHKLGFGLNYLLLLLAICIGVAVWVLMQQHALTQDRSPTQHSHLPLLTCTLTWVVVVSLFYWFVLQ